MNNKQKPSKVNKKQIRMFGMQIDRIDLEESVDCILDWTSEPRNEACRFVVTPNVDHAVMFQRRADLRSAYEHASLILADGAPIVWAAKFLGKKLPGRVAGSDLVPALFQKASERSLENQADATLKPLRVFLLGAAEGVAERAAKKIIAKWQGVQIVGTYSPPIGFENNKTENETILRLVAEAKPDVVILGLGAPKQELWIDAFAGRLDAKIALCVGATIDFLAGEKKRSPVWMQKVGLEWLHRVLTEPRRLFKRYLHDAIVFPQLFWNEWRTERSPQA